LASNIRSIFVMIVTIYLLDKTVFGWDSDWDFESDSVLYSQTIAMNFEMEIWFFFILPGIGRQVINIQTKCVHYYVLKMIYKRIIPEN